MNKVVVGFLVLVAGLVVGWFARDTAPGVDEDVPIVQEQSTQTTPTVQPAGTESTQSGVIATAAVQYMQSGFSPSTLTVKTGTTVVFTNASAGGMWVASAVHPTHQLLPGFDQNQSVMAGGVYQYTFTTPGTWLYHNHVNPQQTGTVVVTQ